MVELEWIKKAVSQAANPYSLTAVEIGGLENRAYSHALVVCIDLKHASYIRYGVVLHQKNKTATCNSRL
ncbi:hypothetical protein SeLEV6574_g03035 [Synchytrium endobioticum]|uniref:Uncharacterized protein n=1 Tax=Synchytrium endobioticum TaxID=286115 RepID=A0A507D5Z9_9FUNG|nr:hypothetical protein SeLEV6574_g03035 [Synchytrium endobioticum]